MPGGTCSAWLLHLIDLSLVLLCLREQVQEACCAR